MSQVWQTICASGALTLIMTLIITQIVNSQFNQMKSWQQTKVENDLLMMTKLDKLGDMTVLMANKLHEAGVINGDLEDLKQDYKKADDKYEDQLRKIAAEIKRK